MKVGPNLSDLGFVQSWLRGKVKRRVMSERMDVDKTQRAQSCTAVEVEQRNEDDS